MGQIAVTVTQKKIDLVYHGIYHQVGDAEIEMITLVTEPLLSIKSPDQTALEA